MRKFKVTINNKVYEVEVEEIKDSAVQQTPKPVEKATAAAPQVATKPVSRPTITEGDSEGKVLAPLPGTISLEVKEGDSVNTGDVLFILEAMKMENEITAPVTGTIKSILVAEGASIDTGDLLAIIE